MPILKPKIGRDYLAGSGIPVRLAGIDDGHLVLQSLASDNRFMAPVHYPLQPFKSKRAALQVRPSPYMGPRAKLRHDPAPPAPLAPIIDALLLKGGLTMQGLAREAKRRASAACRGKDVQANIRARMYWLKRKGQQIKKP